MSSVKIFDEEGNLDDIIQAANRRIKSRNRGVKKYFVQQINRHFSGLVKICEAMDRAFELYC